jgi:hypothetical protein
MDPSRRRRARHCVDRNVHVHSEEHGRTRQHGVADGHPGGRRPDRYAASSAPGCPAAGPAAAPAALQLPAWDSSGSAKMVGILVEESALLQLEASTGGLAFARGAGGVVRSPVRRVGRLLLRHADERTRTSTSVSSRRPERRASANSATSAGGSTLAVEPSLASPRRRPSRRRWRAGKCASCLGCETRRRLRVHGADA